mgnify:CR=1 FL=1
MPKLIKLYITQVAIGFALAGVFVGMLLWFDIANLWHLVTHSDKGVLAVVVLWFANGIVFAGVHFMAESADILGRDDQVVILPNMKAGCSMADMANLEQVLTAWAELEDVLMADPEQQIMPITYINSAANLKAFVGEHGGTVCTSSNAEGALKWAFDRREKVFFFPDGLHVGIRKQQLLDDVALQPDCFGNVAEHIMVANVAGVFEIRRK